jgi:F-type H+-transporting ATPase subunit a
LKRWQIVLLSFATLILVVLGMYAIFGSDGKNEAFQPQEEFRLHPWISIHIGGVDMSINRAVLYLFLAAALTCGTMIWVARRMQQKPNKVQTAVEVSYDLVANNITRGNLSDPKLARRWFVFVATLFFFIWFSNMLGYIPLPTSHEKINIFGADIPALAIYAATANISIRAKGFIGYLKSFVPAGVEGVARFPIFLIEVISNLVRIISLSVRLFANILAGHLLILFMAGGLVVLLGLAPLGVITLLMAVPFFLFEIGLVATLQAFIFSTLTAIYIGGATAEEH